MQIHLKLSEIDDFTEKSEIYQTVPETLYRPSSIEEAKKVNKELASQKSTRPRWFYRGIVPELNYQDYYIRFSKGWKTDKQFSNPFFFLGADIKMMPKPDADNTKKKTKGQAYL